MSGLQIQIGRQAMVVEAARQQADALRKRRARFMCAKYEAHPPQGDPCWKRWEPTGPEDAERRPQSEWCEPCRQREVVHEAYLTAARRLGAQRGALTRLCRRAIAEAAHA